MAFHFQPQQIVPIAFGFNGISAHNVPFGIELFHWIAVFLLPKFHNCVKLNLG